MNTISIQKIRKISALTGIFFMLFSSVGVYFQPAYAQEASQSAQVTGSEPDKDAAPTGSETATPSVSPTVTPTATPEPGTEQLEAVPSSTPPPGGTPSQKDSSLNNLLNERDPQQSERSPRMKRATRFHKLSRKMFKLAEPIVLNVEKDPENHFRASMISKDGKKSELSFVEKLKNDAVGTLTIVPPREITPGAYTIEVEDSQGEKTTYDVLWGVLAINTNKSVFSQNEIAKLAIAVLDEKGEMVCDADVKLSIKNPKGETKELTSKDGISVTDVCTKKIFTMEPDYKAEYKTGEEGMYQMELTAKTKNGTYTIQDKFIVKDNVPFDVERSAPTRTYPVNSYPVTLTITAREDFKGSVTDIVPYGFDISEQEKRFSDGDPNGGVLKYDRVETKSESPKTDRGDEAVLGTSTSPDTITLVKPFEGDHPITLGYGEKYHAEGLVDAITNHLKFDGHEGTDFDMPQGTTIYAAADGKVIVAGEHDYGLTVTIEHVWGKTYYGHLSEILVKEGDEVRAGQEIAKSGSSGESTGPHLHFGMKPNDGDENNGYQGMVDPMNYLPIVKEDVLGESTAAPNLTKEIVWNVDFKKGDTIKVGYQFISPPQSPRLYLLGKARFESESRILFEEKRQWQVAVDAGNGDGMLAYDEDQASNTTPHYRTWDQVDLSAEGQMTDEETAGEESNFTIIKAAPSREEYIRGALTSSGHLDIQVWNGSSWVDGTNAPTNGEFTTGIGTTNDAMRGFDISYEDSSGDALVVYEDTSTANKTIKYRTWDGTQWSNESTLDYTAVAEGGATDVTAWVELEGDPGSDNILLGWQDKTRLGYYGARWDGSAFQHITLINGAGINIARQSFDVAWEGTSGEGLYAYGTGTTTDFSTYTTGGGFADGSNMVNPGTAVNWLRIAGDPNSNYIALILVAGNLSTTASTLYVDMWNGSDWTTVATPTAETDINTYGFSQSVDVAWEAASSDRALFVWRDGPTSETSLRYMVFDISVGQFLAIDDDGGGANICNLTGTATNQQVTNLNSAENSNGPCTGLGTWAGTVSGITLSADPSSRKIMLVAENQTTLDIRPEAQLWNGVDSGTWLVQTSNMGAFEIDASTGVLPSASLPSMPYDFAFNANTATITISGVCKQIDRSTNCANSETVQFAVNTIFGSQSTTTSSGTWTISGVPKPSTGAIITIYINGVADNLEANAVTQYDGTGNISGVLLYEDHLTIGSDDNQSITSTELATYDNSVSTDEDVFFDVSSNNLTVDSVAQSSTEKLFIITSNTYAPTGTITTVDLINQGTLSVAANAITVAGSWSNTGTFTNTCSGSFNTVTFTATSTGKTLSGTLNGSSAFCKVNFNGSGGGWTIQDPMLVSAANATDTFQVTAGTVTLGNGGGDNLDVRGRLTVSASAVFQSMTGLAQGDNTVCNSDDICIEINANSSPPSCSNCTIELSGTLDIDKNVTVRFNSNASVESGINVASTGYLEVKGTQDDTDNSGIDSQAHDAGSTITLSDASQSWTTNQHQYKYLRITNTSSLAYGRMYQISSNAANTVTIPDNNNTEDTGASISGSGNSRTVTSSVSLITADNEGVGQYIYNSTDDTYFLIIDSTNNASTDTFKIIASPSSFPVSLTSKTIKIDDGVRAADTFEILDFAAMTANATNNGFMKSATGSETVLKYGEFSEMGAETALKYGVDFEAINGSNSGEGASISYSYIHDSHRSIRFDSSSHVNRSYTVQGESQGIMYNYIKDASQDGINASSSNSTDIIGNRIQTVTGNKDCLVVWTASKNLIVNNVITTCDPGIYMDISGGNYVVNNKVYNSAGAGISALTASTKNLIVGNSVYSTAAEGINLTGSSATTTQLVGNTVDVAATYGLSQANTAASTIVAANESYGNYVGNTTADVNYGAAAHLSRFYNSKFGSSTEVSGISTANSYLTSWKHDQTAGATRIWNDYVVPDDVTETPQDEGTNKFNYANNLWEDSFTPSMFTGTGTQDNLEFAFSGGTLGGSANQYAYALRCKLADCVTVGTNAWDVYRDGVDIGDASTTSTFTDATTNVQFKIDDAGTNPVRGDLYTFAVYQDAGDSSTQKTTTVMQSDDTITVGSGETIQLLGSTSSTPSIVQKDSGSANGYVPTLSGGTLNANYYTFTGLKSSSGGLNLTSGTVSNLSGGTFDTAVTSGGATDTYVTVSNTILNAGAQSWTEMLFDDGTADSGLEFNVRITVNPSACTNTWTFTGSGNKGGATNGETYDSDSGDGGACNSGNGYLLWADTPTGPTTDQQMRHGNWFSGGVEQNFTF